jgi:hypothetical protein
LKVFIPAYGPQLIKILVGLTLLESIISGTVVIRGAMHGATLLVEEDELELAAAPHVGPLIVLVSIVTEPVCAKARPFKVAPVAIVMDVDARIFPINEVFVPRVAELTTLHHTLHGSPPTILAVPEVIRSDDDLKIHTPDPLRVSVPVR